MKHDYFAPFQSKINETFQLYLSFTRHTLHRTGDTKANKAGPQPLRLLVARIGKTRDLFKKLEITREHFMQRWAQ